MLSPGHLLGREKKRGNALSVSERKERQD